MPTYQYACTSCGERLEVVQKFSDDPLTACPACQGTLRKVFSPVGVVFKGSGFYKTDSRSSAKKQAGGKDRAAESPAPKGDKAATPDSPSKSDNAGSSSGTSSSRTSGT